MEKRRFIMPFVFLLCLVSGREAQGQALTLPQTVDRALKANPELQSVENVIKAKQGAHRQAGAAPNPEIGGVLGNRSQIFEVGQEIEFPGKRKARVDQAGEDVQVARQELKQIQVQIAAQTALLFFDVLAAQRKRELLQENLAVNERFLQAARRKFEQGFGNKLDVVKGQVEVLRAKRLLLEARQELLNKQEHLKILLRVAADDTLRLQGQIERSTFTARVLLDSLLTLANRAHPALLAEQHKLKGAQFAMRAARLAARPDFALDFEGGVEDNESRFEVGLRFPLALWDRKKGAQAEALFLKQSAEFGVESARLELTRRVRAAFRVYASTAQSVRLFEDSLLQEAKSAAETARQAFESGNFRFLDLVDAQRTYLDSALEYNESLHNLRAAEINLMASVGKIVTGDLP
ncbi:MAG: TolC family protein [bacterium]